MRRDIDLYRAIVLQLESEDLPPGSIAEINVLAGELPIDGYTEEQVHYHVRQIIMAGLIDQGGAGSSAGFGFRSLTPAGHDFADSVRDEKIWQMTKKGALEAGGFTVQLLVDLAKGFAKKQIQKLTDVEL
ncbi:DUF2513 domain-containing protein [Pseudomonas syringae]|uniref:DUF2513 domain-containing protein n=1 Tax=Pseudomonas syringae TaxID=317 RepID=UPI000E3176D6|nr:DUF2513 domain-containing protein [Pseudomonas syringae]